jgi:allantoate deiminase
LIIIDDQQWEARSMADFCVSPDEMEAYVVALAAFGAHGETGVWRTVYSREWVAATRQFKEWCAEADLEASEDAVGNIWGKLQGREPGGSIVTGSHIDSQKPGGRYDGALGALAGLLALKLLHRRFGQPKKTLEVVALCEEESSRFPAANFWGSRAITGRISPTDAHTLLGYDGESMAEAMVEAGYEVTAIPSARRTDIDTFIELHIEQGPILEQLDIPVGIVTSITGIRHIVVTLEGIQNHAGAFPMDLRHDPMACASEIISGVINTAHRMGRPAVTTVGRINVYPNGPGVIPGRVEFTIDARHPDSERRNILYARHEALIAEVATRHDIRVSTLITIDQHPRQCDPELVEVFEAAAHGQGISTVRVHSGAAHDAQQMGAIARPMMLFVRSKDGRSHTPEEYSSPEDIAHAVEVLAAGLHDLAY